MHKPKYFLLLLAVLFITTFAFAEQIGILIEKGSLQADRFIVATTCYDCHDSIHGQWKGSAHAVALTDPVFQKISKALYASAQTDAQRHEAEMCIKCHAPVVYGAGIMTTVAQDYAAGTANQMQGIQCDFCHSVSGLQSPPLNTNQYLSPGGGEDDPGIKRGPRNDGETDYHETAYSELHTQARFCGGCHDVRHIEFGTALETTYTEWLGGPYNTGDPTTTVTCQDCHMRQSPGIAATGTTKRPDYPGTAALEGPERDHIWRHTFVGANVFLPKLMNSGDEYAQMARERLQNAASVKIWADGEWERGEMAVLKVKVSNTGAGHDIPTGVTELRQVWLQVEIKNEKGEVIYSSGSVDDNGNIEAGSVIYHTTLGDSQGNPTANIMVADRILHDYRISPGGYRLEDFFVMLPKRHAKKLTAEVKLLYRGLPAEIIALLGASAPEVPTVEMAAATVEIKTK